MVLLSKRPPVTRRQHQQQLNSASDGRSIDAVHRMNPSPGSMVPSQPGVHRRRLRPPPPLLLLPPPLLHRSREKFLRNSALCRRDCKVSLTTSLLCVCDRQGKLLVVDDVSRTRNHQRIIALLRQRQEVRLSLSLSLSRRRRSGRHDHRVTNF